MPAGQSEQALLPVPLAYEPDGQVWQVGELLVWEYLPAAQGTHAIARACCPGAHCWYETLAGVVESAPLNCTTTISSFSEALGGSVQIRSPLDV